jgi:hypothetical protein
MSRAKRPAVRPWRNRKKKATRLLSHCERIDAKLQERVDKLRKDCRRSPFYLSAISNDVVNPCVHYAGLMNVPCSQECGALHFTGESTQCICCDTQGHGSHETMSVLPEYMDPLLRDKDFRTNI